MSARKRSWDENGRVCANMACAKEGEHQPWASYNKDKHHASGYKPRCKVCRRAEDKLFRLQGPKDAGESRCHTCGTIIEYQFKAKMCPACKRKNRQFAHSFIYVCVVSPLVHWKGGHFQTEEMNEMLAWGYWEEGMLFEEWYKGDFLRAVMISGEQCPADREKAAMPQSTEQVQGHVPQGDGMHLRVTGPLMVYFTRQHVDWKDEIEAAYPIAVRRLDGPPTYLLLPEDDEIQSKTFRGLTVIHTPYLYPLQYALSKEAPTNG